MKKFFFWTILIFLVLSCVELVSLAAIWYLKKTEQRTYAPLIDYSIPEKYRQQIMELLNDDLEYSRFDPDLGWAIKKNGEKGLYRTNSQGIRSDREYAPNTPDGILRIETFGDSFTHGDEVANDQTWQAQMEASVPQLEVLNFGVPGYGLDQAYLRYLKEGARFSPDIVLIGLTLPMFERSVSVFNPFRARRTNVQLSKPRFIIENNKLKLIPNPFRTREDYEKLLNGKHDLKETRKYDLYYRRLYRKTFWDVFASVRLFKMLRQKGVEANIARRKLVLGGLRPDTEAFRVTTEICKQFYRDVLDHGAKPIVAILPDGINVLSKLEYNKEQMEALISFLEENKMDYIPLNTMFDNIEREKLPEYFAPKKHYSPKGNELCAKKVLEYLAIKGYINKNLLKKN